MVFQLRNLFAVAALALAISFVPQQVSAAGDDELNKQLLSAVSKGNLETTERLLNEGANPDVTGDFGFFPLIYAAQDSNLKMTKLLIENGAEADNKTSDGYTPLIAAAEHGSVRITALLLSSGANPQTKTRKGRMPSCLQFVLVSRMCSRC
ncbi:ankyrin repeat domain-containing protein [Candidatus Reidiella endopervernicosa]|uniref:Ankyrin repeat domain-containing protein n=1 Tax=Candidatus Reidiella endopervernicosa TaxID=2738883 RepID=A0A6N0HWM5_9GAMM|nr:ankyrin repeat domain-containing protein [Candidatus Reidiella endopervernicosa]QKQ26641.1 ankyrin repeat domain-containing protein [Candidatus Reidiella endopervernicosa]